MINPEVLQSKFKNTLKEINTMQMSGKLTKVVGLVLESNGPKAPIGEICILRDKNGKEVSRSEIVGFKDENRILSMVLGELNDIAPGMEIKATGESLHVNVGNGLIGRVIDGLGNPIDGKGPIIHKEQRSIYASPPNPLLRDRISEPVATGVKAIDSVLAMGKGQRMGIFAGSGVGKSTLLGMIARNTTADINVIALIGERGREVREFIEKDLGEDGLRRSVVIVATSDMASLVRVKAALVATTIAEYFRDMELDVMFMMDSVTRLAMAQREVGLAIGEPPTTKGYTPSVFSLLQKTLERAGTSEKGTISALYTVLVEGDDFNEPISDTVRGILDGHIILSRKLAALGHYPAIDVSESVSRVMRDISSKMHVQAAVRLRQLIAIYKGAEDLISVGAYQRGTNADIDRAIELMPKINNFLKQDVEDQVSLDEIINELIEIVE